MNIANTERKTTSNETWHLIDVSGQNLGKIASHIASILQGKHNVNYVPYLPIGDFVVAVNASKLTVTGNNKMTQKIYYRHSGYPGGIRGVTLETMMSKDPSRVLYLAVKGMLPKNKLGRKLLGRLKIFADEKHTHIAQIKGLGINEALIENIEEIDLIFEPDRKSTKVKADKPDKKSTKIKDAKKESSVTGNVGGTKAIILPKTVQAILIKEYGEDVDLTDEKFVGLRNKTQASKFVEENPSSAK